MKTFSELELRMFVVRSIRVVLVVGFRDPIIA